ncbi:MAG: DNA methyltransferase [Candidatus Sericytochromatia bacterium]|nr:DNA methyltransferase [Candidatus Sericytochromatia bacterium]
MEVDQYIKNINQRYKLGNSTEHTFRGDLQQLIESIVPNISATNEPKRQSCGAPDYILTSKDIPIGFIEAKNIGDKDLEGRKKTGNKEQFDRYKASLSNIIFTDYLDFYLYRDGQLITRISIAELNGNSIKPIPQNFNTFNNIIKDFCSFIGQTIKSPQKLAQMMAGKSRLLSDVIEKALTSDEDNLEDSTLKDQMIAFKNVLIHDITPKEFADVYAQTIAYGMFAARLHDPDLATFSRQEASELIPKSNPFLRKLFGYIIGPDIDDRIKWIVDSLTEIFLACNVEEILKNYGQKTKMEDPIIHFYETFLAEYDPKLRKSRGVWYTPAPVVQFIVRAVDDILKSEFDIPKGLLDTATTKINVNSQTIDKRSKTGFKIVEKEVHKVQILDPATGTGTFLAEVIKYIHKKFKGQEGIWSGYVESHLLPRLNGFELLMASYAMAHLQLDLLLKESGFKPSKLQRTRVYLTNSLEEHHPDTGTLFANWLSSEANEANYIKRDTPVMCVIGNPPYNGESSNKGDWIMNLMEDYKKEPGGIERLNERNPKWINDDYVKFLRLGQHLIEKNGFGLLAFINPHGFLDNPTFRGVRWSLLKTFDKIYTIDLHGNSKKKETSPDGSVDENVFDIQQGVSINIFIKTGKKKSNELGKVFHYDLYGKRESKYKFLLENSLNTIPFSQLTNSPPSYFMVQKDFDLESTYNKGFSVNELFIENNMGITTGNDKEYVHINKNILIEKYGDKHVQEVEYRTFDKRYLNYDSNLLARARFEFMKHFFHNNIAISFVRRSRKKDFVTPYLTQKIVDKCIISTLDNANIFPLYTYSDITDENDENNENKIKRTPNLNEDIIKKLSKKINLTFSNEKENTKNTYAPIDILDYIYAMCYSKKYREVYKEFLEIDFPRIPYPKDKNSFLFLVNLGNELRQAHLLNASIVEEFITSYPVGGSNKVNSVINWDLCDSINKLGKVWINEEQYFDQVPLIAWEFQIGGYKPAQKWLKDRKGSNLDFDDVLHFQKIIVALTESAKIVEKINSI